MGEPYHEPIDGIDPAVPQEQHGQYQHGQALVVIAMVSELTRSFNAISHFPKCCPPSRKQWHVFTGRPHTPPGDPNQSICIPVILSRKRRVQIVAHAPRPDMPGRHPGRHGFNRHGFTMNGSGNGIRHGMGSAGGDGFGGAGGCR